MKKLEFEIAGIPALLVGEPSERLYLYVHGKMGCKEEALDFAERACPAGYQVLAIDLPEHGQRKGRTEKLLPWVAVPELQAVYRYAAARWPEVSLRATSIGAWLSMQALQRMPLEGSACLTCGGHGRPHHPYDAVGGCHRGTAGSERRDSDHLRRDAFMALSLLGEGASHLLEGADTGALWR